LGQIADQGLLGAADFPGAKGVAVAATTPTSATWATAHGENLHDALGRLRERACVEMVGMTAEGVNPMVSLGHGQTDHPEIRLNVKHMFPLFLRYLRVKKGLSQERMAERLFLPVDEYAVFEQLGANPRLSELDEIHQALGHRVIELLYGLPPKE